MDAPAAGRNAVQCPHCEHMVSSGVRCSNCGVRLKKPVRHWVIRAVVVLVIGGLFLLQLHAKKHIPPLVAIGEITPLKSLRPVRIEGVLESDARKLQSGAVFYVVDDGSGTLSVFSNVEPAGKLPMSGSRVAFTGKLSGGAGNEVRMQAYQVEVLQGPVNEDYISEFRLSDISADLLGERLTAFGKVSKYWKPSHGSNAPYKIVLKDPGGTLDVVHWLKNPPDVQVGDVLEISGMVSEYKGRLQLKVRDADDIQPFQENSEPSVWLEIGDITAEHEDDWVIVEGVLGEPRSIPGGVIYPLTDSSGSIAALFWDKNVSGEQRDALDEGVRIRIEAPVVVYKGNLELVPPGFGSFQIIE